MPIPVVSIITPTFQRAKDLWRVLEVVRLQRWGEGEIEHLVIPDGPPDRATQTVLRAFPEEERILRRCVPLPDSQGQFGAACKDAGLREATGRYVVFWDDDNWFYPHALQCLLVSGKRNASVWSTTRWLLILPAGERVRSRGRIAFRTESGKGSFFGACPIFCVSRQT